MEDDKVVLIDVVFLYFCSKKSGYFLCWELFALFLIHKFIRGPPPLIINLKKIDNWRIKSE